MRFSPSTHLLANAMICSFFLEQEESFIVLTNKFPFPYFEYTLKRLLGGFLFITQYSETRLV
jgi:hypothetical protein